MVGYFRVYYYETTGDGPLDFKFTNQIVKAVSPRDAREYVSENIDGFDEFAASRQGVPESSTRPVVVHQTNRAQIEESYQR